MKKLKLSIVVCCLFLSACEKYSSVKERGSDSGKPGNEEPGKSPNKPGAPTSLAVASGDHEVTLSWEAPSAIGSSAITHYEYQKRTSDGAFDDTWEVIPGGESVREYLVSSLNGATTYSFRVRAENSVGEGPPSEEIEGTAYDGPTAEPGKPTSLTAISGNLQVTLSWEIPGALGASSITHYEYQKRTSDGAFDNTWEVIPGGESVREYLVSSLNGATTYSFRVRAENGAGEGPPSEEIEGTAYDGPTAEPGAPTNLAATPGDHQVRLNWEAPSALGASAITHYEYQKRTSDGAFDNTWEVIPGGESVRAHTVSSLTGGTTYSFRVRAENGAGEGPPSEEIEGTAYDGPTAEPGAPRDLAATPGDHRVTLNWEAPSALGASAITHYEYQKRTSDGAFDNTWEVIPGGESVREYLVSSLTGGTTYFFRVRAVSGAGKGTASTEMAGIAYDGSTAEPGPPVKLTATSGDHEVTLSWEVPSHIGASAITGYEYQKRTSDGAFDTWKVIPGGESVREYLVSGLTGATTYSFRVRAVNGAGKGTASTEMAGIAYDGSTAEPGAPTNLAATSSGDRQVTLNWEAPSALGASAITHYEYQKRTSDGAFDNTWEVIPGGESVRQYIVSSLDGATTYSFRVRAVNDASEGPPSEEIEGTAYDGPTAEPGAPTNLAATSGDHQVRLNWEAPSALGASAITHYEYQKKTSDGAFDNTWEVIPGGESVREYIVSSLDGATTYSFRVRAENGAGEGPPSEEIEGTAYDGPTAEPGAPTNLAATSGDHQVTLNWEAPSALGASAITHYEYQKKMSDGAFDNTWEVIPGGESARTHTVSSLTGATTYSFRVRAENGAGEGPPSEEIEGTAYDGPTAEPGAPTNLAATPGDHQVTLNWEAPSAIGSSEIIHYEYQKKASGGAFDNTWEVIPGGESVRQYLVSGLTGATTYSFQVRAVNGAGEGPPSSEIEGTAYDGPTAEPGAPTNLAATSGDHQVRLNWAAPSTLGASAITHYEYQKKTSDGAFDDTWEVIPGGESVREYFVSGLTGGTTYSFRVRAENSAGEGPPSEEIEGTAYDGPTAEPGAPRDLAATPGDYEVTLSWSAPSAIGASAITHYEYRKKTSDGAFDDIWEVIPGEKSARTHTVSSLTGGTIYSFQVRAVNTEGGGLPSEEADATVLTPSDEEPSVPFVSTWKTGSDNESITLPLPSGYEYNFTVDWGDTSTSQVTSHDDTDKTHTYATAGTYTVTISGTVEGMVFQQEREQKKDPLC